VDLLWALNLCEARGRTRLPAVIDRNEREYEIYVAATKILGDRGPDALTLRNLADELGGSITLVTHMYPDRAALIKGITRTAIREFDREIERLERGADQTERLRSLLMWMLPLTPSDQRRERGRVMLVGYRDSDLNVGYFFVAMDRKMRELLRDHLVPFLDGDDLEMAIELIRTTINGVVLSAAEHPGKWPRQRITALLNHVLSSLEIDVVLAPRSRVNAAS
jgi:AcrR family transcriptional regulator